MKITRSRVAEEMKISKGHWSDIMTGKRPVGKQVAKKIAGLTRRPWHFYLDMQPAEIEGELRAAVDSGDGDSLVEPVAGCK